MSLSSHATLLDALKHLDAYYAVTPISDLTTYRAIQVSRIREVLHFGARLCDTESGTAEEIKTLVDERVREIEDETEPFMLHEMEGQAEMMEEDDRIVEELPVINVEARENMADMTGFDADQAEQPTPVMPVTPPGRCLDALVGDGGELVHEPITIWEDSPQKAPSTPSDNSMELHVEDEQDAETNSNTNLNESEASIPDNSDEFRTFHDVRIELEDALAQYEETFLDDANTLDYYETQQAFKDGIQQAITPRKGLTPEKLWQNVEQSVLTSANMKRRREYASIQDMQDVPSAPVKSAGSSSSHDVRVVPTLLFRDLEIDTSHASQDGDEGEEDENVRRMMVEVAEEDGEYDEYVVFPETPTHSPTHSPKQVREAGRKRKMEPILDSLDEYSLMSVGKQSRSTGKAAPTDDAAAPPSHTPPASPDKMATRLNAVQQPPVSPAYNFTPIKHAGKPLTTAPPIMQNFYRSTVQNTLEELLNSTASEEVKDLLNAYWEHIEKEVPAPEATPASQLDRESTQPSQPIPRPGWLSTVFRNNSPRHVNRNGWR